MGIYNIPICGDGEKQAPLASFRADARQAAIYNSTTSPLGMSTMPPHTSPSTIQPTSPATPMAVQQPRRYRSQLQVRSRQPSDSRPYRTEATQGRSCLPRRDPHHSLHPRMLADPTIRMEDGTDSSVRGPTCPRPLTPPAPNRPDGDQGLRLQTRIREGEIPT